MRGLMQSNIFHSFCCWLNVNEDLHSPWLEENLGLLWFLSVLPLIHMAYFSVTLFSLGENSFTALMSSGEI